MSESLTKLGADGFCTWCWNDKVDLHNAFVDEHGPYTGHHFGEVFVAAPNVPLAAGRIRLHGLDILPDCWT